MTAIDEAEVVTRPGAFAPLQEQTFRTIWIASIFSNFGQLILGVGAAWEMTRLTSDRGMVALVQTALMLPLMLVAMPAGAVADMFDHRRIAMTGLAFAIIFSVMLSVICFLGGSTPWVLLAFCALIGAGVALFTPAWQASIREQVSREHLPAAIALGSISFNIARSVGPAIGGVIVAAAGAQTAFGVNAMCYLPIFIAFFLWRRRHVPSRLPPERIDRAIVAGIRYAFHSPPIRIVIIRVFVFGVSTASYVALAAVVARDLLNGTASTFGILLGAAGVGAISGAMLLAPVRDRLGVEHSARLCMLASAGALALIGLSHHLALSCLGFFLVGGGNILTVGMFNVTVQLSAPRWVTARVLSLYSSALTGGVAIGAIIWGHVAQQWSISTAMIASGGAMFATLLVGLPMRLPRTSNDALELVEIGQDPDVALDLTLRSGPVTIEIDYNVDPDRAREFYDLMRQMQRIRKRNGGFGWSLSRDVGDPARWTERYECPTWGDYLRMRGRLTEADREAQALADAYHRSDGAPRIRRRLERPFGSVRWRAESPDPQQDSLPMLTP